MQWNHLEIVDRANGESTKIRLDDARSADKLKAAALACGMTVAAAWDVLLHGGELTTAGYVRRLTK